MRTIAMTMLACLALVCLTGMGGLGGAPEGRPPETSENIRVRLTDRSDVTTELSHFSMNGKVSLEGSRGEAKISVPFKEIRTIEAGEAGKDEVTAAVTLKSGEVIPLGLRKRAIFFGDTGYGLLQIRAGDVLRIEVL